MFHYTDFYSADDRHPARSPVQTPEEIRCNRIGLAITILAALAFYGPIVIWLVLR